MHAGSHPIVPHGFGQGDGRPGAPGGPGGPGGPLWAPTWANKVAMQSTLNIKADILNANRMCSIKL